MDNMTNVQATPLPTMKLKSDRSVVLFIVLSIVTCGIYYLVMMCIFSDEANKICTKSDGKKTMLYILAVLLGCITMGIVPLVWYHRYYTRIGNEARKRGLPVNFGAFDFWIFQVLLGFTIIAPIYFFYKFIKTTNLLNASYNERG